MPALSPSGFVGIHSVYEKNALCLRKKPEIKFKELAVPRHINGAVNYYDLDTGHS